MTELKGVGMPGLLRNLRVVEMAHPLTEYAGAVWAGLGAEVWLVEPPGGATTRYRRPSVPGVESPRSSLAFLARNTNKKSVVVDPADPTQVRLLRDLCDRADVVLDADSSPFHALDLRSATPMVTVTDALGLGTSSIVGFAASGGLASSGWPHQPPCNAPSWLALDGAGVYAAVMAAVAVLCRRRGHIVHYEIPYAEAAVSAVTPWSRPLHSYGMQAAGQGTLTARLGPDGFPIYEARDGYVRILAGTPKQWQAFVDLLGRPEELVTGVWSERRFRMENADALKLFCAELIRERPAMELFKEGQERGLTISPVQSLRDFRNDDHVRARSVFVTVDDPEFGAMELMRPPLLLEPAAMNVVVSPAPALDAHGAEGRALARARVDRVTPAADPDFDVDRPLRDRRILDLGVGAVVPEAASLLAQLGADVIKVESLVHVDFLRRSGLAGAMDVNNSPTFNQLNLGVKSVAIDLSRPEGVRILHRLAACCDTVMENNRGPVVARWGLDFDAACALRPGLVYLRSQGLGTGPYDGYQTFGPNLQTFAGVTHQWAHPDDPFPVGTTLNHPDHIAGKQSLVAVLGAWLEGPTEGCLIDAAQFEAAASLIGDRHLGQFFAPEEDVAPVGNASPDMAPHGCYRCLDEDDDERWVAIAAEDDGHWQSLVDVVGEDWTADPAYGEVAGRLANARVLDEHLGRWTATRSVDDVERALRAAGVPVSRVVTADDMAAAETSFFPAVAHPTSGTRSYTAVPVLRRGGGRPATRRPPLLGEHTEAVLYELLGLAPDEVDRLTASKVVGN